MPRNHIIYNNLGVFVGPAPASGFHFIDNNGVLNDNYTISTGNYNLIKPIIRTQEVSYDFNISRNDIKALGKATSINRPIVNMPTINVEFSYLQNGLINENRMGFYTNYPFRTDTGVAYYSDNFAVCCLSGFISRKLDRENNELQWPYNYRDKRNIFVPLSKEGQDLNTQVTGQTSSNSNNIDVVCFGNSYLYSYKTQGAVASIPSVTVGYLAENMVIYSSGSGCLLPSVDAKNLSYFPRHFSIPSIEEGNMPVSVLLPGDISLDLNVLRPPTTIYATEGTGAAIDTVSTDIKDIGVKFSDIKLQNYSIDLGLNRENLTSLGYKLPLDKEIIFPVFANLGVGMIVGDYETGNFTALMSKNNDYNLTLRINNPPSADIQQTAVQYDFRRAKLNNVSNSASIGQHKVVSMSFTSEIDPKDFSKGFFMSGLLNIDRSMGETTYLIQEDGGGYILQEDGYRIVVNAGNLFF